MTSPNSLLVSPSPKHVVAGAVATLERLREDDTLSLDREELAGGTSALFRPHELQIVGGPLGYLLDPDRSPAGG